MIHAWPWLCALLLLGSLFSLIPLLAGERDRWTPVGLRIALASMLLGSLGFSAWLLHVCTR